MLSEQFVKIHKAAFDKSELIQLIEDRRHLATAELLDDIVTSFETAGISLSELLYTLSAVTSERGDHWNECCKILEMAGEVAKKAEKRN